jgi:hypothetical protein
MKKRILVILSLIFVLGLFVTGFAVNRTNTPVNKTASECPMKKDSQSKPDMSKVMVVISDEDCCQKGADCCKGGACCHKKS